jgi:hypothetical protein
VDPEPLKLVPRPVADVRGLPKPCPFGKVSEPGTAIALASMTSRIWSSIMCSSDSPKNGAPQPLSFNAFACKKTLTGNATNHVGKPSMLSASCSATSSSISPLFATV